MKRQDLDNLMIDLLYDELDDTTTLQVRSELAHDHPRQQLFDQFKMTRHRIDDLHHASDEALQPLTSANILRTARLTADANRKKHHTIWLLRPLVAGLAGIAVALLITTTIHLFKLPTPSSPTTLPPPTVVLAHGTHEESMAKLQTPPPSAIPEEPQAQELDTDKPPPTAATNIPALSMKTSQAPWIVMQADEGQQNETSLDYFARGSHALQENDHAAAVRSFTYALEYEPNNEASYYHRALAYQALGQHIEAIQDFRQLLNHYPLSPLQRPAQLALVHSLVAVNSLDAAIDQLEELASGSDHLALQAQQQLDTLSPIQGGGDRSPDQRPALKKPRATSAAKEKMNQRAKPMDAGKGSESLEPAITY